MSNKKEKRVLCGLCDKPIHVDDWGGVCKEYGLFHTVCIISKVKQQNRADLVLDIEPRGLQRI